MTIHVNFNIFNVINQLKKDFVLKFFGTKVHMRATQGKGLPSKWL